MRTAQGGRGRCAGGLRRRREVLRPRRAVAAGRGLTAAPLGEDAWRAGYGARCAQRLWQGWAVGQTGFPALCGAGRAWGRAARVFPAVGVASDAGLGTREAPPNSRMHRSRRTRVRSVHPVGSRRSGDASVGRLYGDCAMR
jgi:hypothetical protein